MNEGKCRMLLFMLQDLPVAYFYVRHLYLSYFVSLYLVYRYRLFLYRTQDGPLKAVACCLAVGFGTWGLETRCRGRLSGLARGRLSGLTRSRLSGLAQDRLSELTRSRLSELARGRLSGLARGWTPHLSAGVFLSLVFLSCVTVLQRSPSLAEAIFY